MKKKIVFVLLLMSVLFINFGSNFVYAQSDNLKDQLLNINSEYEKAITICDESGNYLFSQESVNIGDKYIDKDYNVYEVYIVDSEYGIGYAKLINKINMPKLKKLDAKNISNNNSEKKIGLYMTHNDESYILGDGTDSVYGNGGILDIATQLKEQLIDLGIKTELDTTLHIPHNSSAYSRSSSTAQKLINTKVDALFDIHRDGVARSAYVTNYEGKEKCKVRIVIGQANPNCEQNLKFALYLMAVASETYPWLFADIYYAKGHYNQALSNKMLLFEMGTYLAEKDLVEKSVPALAEVINTTLYNTVIDESGDIIINANESSTQKSVNTLLDNQEKSGNVLVIVLVVTTSIFVIFMIGYIIKMKVQ